MKALRTKVILSGIVLVFAFIATIGTTFAWFTVSTTATVESMELNVNASDNLLIRVRPFTGGAFTTPTDLNDVNTYKTSITTADINGVFEDDLNTLGLQPTTVIEPGYLKYDATTLHLIDDLSDVDRTLTSATGNSTTGHYIELQFYLYSQSAEDQYIEMSLPAISAVTAENNATGQNNVANAVRLSVFSGEATGTPGTPQIFGNDIEYSFAFTSGNAGFLAGDSTLTPASTPFNSLSDLSAQPTDLATSVTLISGYVPANDNPDVVVISPNIPTLVSVLIYVEGWDGQAANDIIEAVFAIEFGFEFGVQD